MAKETEGEEFPYELWKCCQKAVLEDTIKDRGGVSCVPSFTDVRAAIMGIMTEKRSKMVLTRALQIAENAHPTGRYGSGPKNYPDRLVWALLTALGEKR